MAISNNLLLILLSQTSCVILIPKTTCLKLHNARENKMTMYSTNLILMIKFHCTPGTFGYDMWLGKCDYVMVSETLSEPHLTHFSDWVSRSSKEDILVHRFLHSLGHHCYKARNSNYKQQTYSSYLTIWKMSTDSSNFLKIHSDSRTFRWWLSKVGLDR